MALHTRPDVIAGGGNEHPAIRGFIGVLQTTTVARALRNNAFAKISRALDLGHAILHAAIDETFLCVRRATGNKEMFDASPMTCTAVKD